MEKKAEVAIFITNGFDQEEFADLLRLFKQKNICAQIILIITQHEDRYAEAEIRPYISLSYWLTTNQANPTVIVILGDLKHSISFFLDPRIMRIFRETLDLGGRVWILRNLQWLLFAADSRLFPYRNQILPFSLKDSESIRKLFLSIQSCY